MLMLFYIVGGVAILAGLSVVLQETPVYSALSLIVVLCCLAVIYLLLGAEFLAVIQVIVYAGAIMVLFVLVIMLLNARREAPAGRSRMARWLGVPLLFLFFGQILYATWQHFSNTAAAAEFAAGPKAIGGLLFRTYALPFELTSILILVAILGAVVLAKKQI
jgi:NADH-quinone oxidoreductase subunit J